MLENLYLFGMVAIIAANLIGFGLIGSIKNSKKVYTRNKKGYKFYK